MDTDGRIILVVIAHPGATITQISDAICVSESATRHRCRNLVATGKLISITSRPPAMYKASPSAIHYYEQMESWRIRYRAAVDALDAKFDLGIPRHRQWIARYLFRDSQTDFYKYNVKGRNWLQRIPAQLWRLKPRTVALETLATLPASLLDGLSYKPVPIDKPHRGIAPIERGDFVPPVVSAAWAEMGAGL